MSEPAAEGEPEREEPEDGEPDQRPRAEDARAASPLARLRRFAPFFLVGGLIVAATQVIPHAPRDRSVELRLEDPASIVAVEIAWTAVDAREQSVGEPLAGGVYRFAPGTAPATIKAPTQLSDGRYAIDARLERVGERADRSVLRRVITLDDQAGITIPLR
ncbi:MAG: hypothetical protein U0359_19530 [Byssovorax sp.]